MYQGAHAKVSFLCKINKALDCNQILDVFFVNREKCMEKHLISFEKSPFDEHLLMKKIEGCFDSSDFSSSEDGIDPVLQILMVLSQTHYLQIREPIHKLSSNLDIYLYNYKTSRPDIFRQEGRIYPQTFDLLVSQLAKMLVFYNQDEPPPPNCS